MKRDTKAIKSLRAELLKLAEQVEISDREAALLSKTLAILKVLAKTKAKEEE